MRTLQFQKRRHRPRRGHRCTVATRPLSPELPTLHDTFVYRWQPADRPWRLLLHALLAYVYERLAREAAVMALEKSGSPPLNTNHLLTHITTLTGAKGQIAPTLLPLIPSCEGGNKIQHTSASVSRIRDANSPFSSCELKRALAILRGQCSRNVHG